MLLENAIDKDFRGCILIQKDAATIWERAYGYADLPNHVPNTIHTKFATASAGKGFVAVAILQLIEQGMLRLEDRLGDLLHLDLHQIDPTITIAELLSHTSGIPDYFDESVMDEYEELWVDLPNYKMRRNSDLLPLFIERPMLYPRGIQFQYNNTGYVVLALILEQLTGRPFDEYLEQHIFRPCGMADTGYYALDQLPAGCANHYIYDKSRNGYRTNIYSVEAKGTGAGGAYTTVRNIAAFWQNLLEGRLLSAGMVAEMMANHSGVSHCYGYGVWLKKMDDQLIPYFQGSDPGVSFMSSFDAQHDLLTVLVSNYGDNVWQLHQALRAACLG